MYGGLDEVTIGKPVSLSLRVPFFAGNDIECGL